MKQHILFFFLFIINGHSLMADRTFRVVNKCQQTIWMGVQQGSTNTNPLPMNGGFEVAQGQTKEVTTPDDWESARFWPRTGCRDEDGKFKCQTGSCGAESNSFQMECQGIGGEKPSTLAEFTLHNAQHNDPDTYDMSNVDGHNIGMSIKPIEGTYEKVNNSVLDKYNCGTLTCNFNMNHCPLELTMDDGNSGKVCLSICAAIHNAQQREKHDHLKKIFDNEETRSLVCCSEDKGYNHSPYNKEDREQGKKLCEVEKWPRSSNDKQYDQIFKEQCEDAYSWQFDDLKSTYQCKNAHYEITLCPSGDALNAQNNSGINGIKHTTRKLIEHLANSASSTSPVPSITSQAPVDITTPDESTAKDQCHSYCMANLGFYLQQKPKPISSVTDTLQASTDVAIEESPTIPSTNQTDQNSTRGTPLLADTVWKRVFEDDFNKDGEIDTSKWDFDIGTGEGKNGWGNNESQYYTENRRENARCENGQLIIQAHRENFEDRQYTSARLKSKQMFLYGRLQIRAKLPSGKGTWSALWLLPEHKIYGEKYWPDNGEIDLMEQVGYEPTKIVSTVHTQKNNHMNNNQPTNSVEISDATTQHKIYTLQWNPEKIEMFVGPDEAQAFQTSIFVWEKQDKDWTQWPFDKPFRIIMNLAIGGTWGGKEGIDESCFPQHIEIDWVHFDQNK